MPVLAAVGALAAVVAMTGGARPSADGRLERRVNAAQHRPGDGEERQLEREPAHRRIGNDETEGWQCWLDGGTCAGISYEPSDPDHDLAASLHSYNFNACDNQSCWTSQLAPVAAKVPLIAGEIGENDCAASYIDPLMTWLDSRKASYLAWAWNADFSCSGGPGLITDYNGTPTAYGAGYESHHFL